jgi:5-methylcytosine-specific restriction enzyme subunit McrC
VSQSRHLCLDELDQSGRVVHLSQGQAVALERTRLVDVRPERKGWRLLPRGSVGSVRIGDLQIDVRPKDKVGLGRLLFLLGYAQNPGFIPGEVAAHEADDLWPALAESLIRHARAALAPGVLQGYRTIDEARRSILGRIRIGDQLCRHPGQMVPIEVTYDDFTRDIAENRILRGALRRMLAVPGLDARSQASLGHLDGQLTGVRIPTPGAPLPSWRQTRLNQRYVPALHLAQIILRNASTESGPDRPRTAAFVVDMARVYEDFVGKALTEALAGRPGRTRAQYPARLDQDPDDGLPGIQMYIDLAHLIDGRPRIIFDAKYKAANANGQYPNADYYQMLAYCTALRLSRAWLVYASGGVERERRLRHTGITVVEYPLDLAVEPHVLLARIDALANVAWRSLCRPGDRHPGRKSPTGGIRDGDIEIAKERASRVSEA